MQHFYANLETQLKCQIVSETHVAPGMLLREQSTQAFASSPAEGRVVPVLSEDPGATEQPLPYLTRCRVPLGCFRLVSKAFSDTNTKAHS